MITKELINTIIEEKLTSDECYLVDLKVSAGNKITVLIDSLIGINIDYCIQISRLIEGSLDREVEDFELEVSTPGLGQAFKVHQQYVKNIGRDIEVIPLEGAPLKGKLTEVSDECFTIQEEKKVKIEGKKKKELKTFSHNYKFDEIKSAKLIISF
ncbi:ribosome assembly cofactor RimP [Plebeiibacterium marinum]|uniref:Ribosome maturation factor RimP n=1 Tax=Plebeiibacterium marinum TaxID=2992111 RepID=A0AAE3MC92_9BACT|nr:ribosome assembly cofactor RimP [Plebeiobacterium marinum]MCW3805078.1 ribosome assembly cofactor RimP [Plebeiobacterium marinum]